eukprot:9468353-Pyramimonas_sp.AAC.1
MAPAPGEKFDDSKRRKLLMSQFDPGLSLAKLHSLAKEFGLAGADQDMRRILNQELNVGTPLGGLMPIVNISLATGMDPYPSLCCNPMALLFTLCSKI